MSLSLECDDDGGKGDGDDDGGCAGDVACAGDVGCCSGSDGVAAADSSVSGLAPPGVAAGSGDATVSRGMDVPTAASGGNGSGDSNHTYRSPFKPGKSSSQGRSLATV